LTRDRSKECGHVFQGEVGKEMFRVEVDATILDISRPFDSCKCKLLGGRLDGVAPELRPVMPGVH
jgi:hypothetical protein